MGAFLGLLGTTNPVVGVSQFESRLLLSFVYVIILESVLLQFLWFPAIFYITIYTENINKACRLSNYWPGDTTR